jgi:hypothetical protein
MGVRGGVGVERSALNGLTTRKGAAVALGAALISDVPVAPDSSGDSLPPVCTTAPESVYRCEKANDPSEPGSAFGPSVMFACVGMDPREFWPVFAAAVDSFDSAVDGLNDRVGGGAEPLAAGASSN